jgi:large subunit ribosomal protein L13
MTTTTTQTRTYTIDATGKRLGAIATEAASVLLGKNETDFTKHLVAPVTVAISNASKMDIPEKKKQEVYQRYSGYPGGLYSETLVHLGERRGYGEALRRTIAGMLPTNKLKKPMLKNLVITE